MKGNAFAQGHTRIEGNTRAEAFAGDEGRADAGQDKDALEEAIAALHLDVSVVRKGQRPKFRAQPILLRESLKAKASVDILAARPDRSALRSRPDAGNYLAA